ncbi:hypothetical protein Tco_1165616 [Tanacetum coccineum]
MSTPVNTSSTDSQMQQHIMSAGQKIVRRMLWTSEDILSPYTPTSVLIAAVEAAENILPVAAHEEAETIHNMTTENKLYFQAEKEAIFLILTGIRDEIYSLGTKPQKIRMYNQSCNLLPHDQCKYPDTMAMRSPNQLLLKSESVSEGDSDPEQLGGIRICKELGTPCLRQFGNQRTMTGFGHYARGTQVAKRVKDYAYHKEKMDDCAKQAEQGVHFKLEQVIAIGNRTEELQNYLDESWVRALGEATSSRDSCLIALQTKQTELEKYTALNDLTSDYKILKQKLSIRNTDEASQKESVNRSHLKVNSKRKCKENRLKKQPSCKENASNVFGKNVNNIMKSKDLKAQMQDKIMVINELKTLILVTKGKVCGNSVDKPSVVDNQMSTDSK